MEGKYLVVKSLLFNVVSYFLLPRLLTTCWYLGGMLITHVIGSATILSIVSCLFVYRVVSFIINDLKKIRSIGIYHKYHIVAVTWEREKKIGYYSITSHKKSHGKIVHRLCSSCISSVQVINKDSIEFSLSTQTWRVIKLSRLSYYTTIIYLVSIFIISNESLK